MDVFMKGFLVGLSIAAPVGPIGVLCIRRTLSSGPLYGFITGMGAAITDFIYAFIGGFGLTMISGFLVSYQNIFRLIGGFFIIYLGYKIITTQTTGQQISLTEKNLFMAFLSAFTIAITNPIALIYYIAVFSGMGNIILNPSYSNSALLVAGVFIGSALWWLFLSQFIGVFKNKINNKSLRVINVVSGGVIVGFGFLALISAIL